MLRLFSLTLLVDTATKFLVSKSCIVNIYEYSLSIVGSGPMVFIDILSNVIPGVSVGTIGCRVFRTSFFN